ncbi:YkoF family thiamine/hydroxymethylpyrimidine-binding protein [Citricoccus sp. GCM10030269]|uniref:YkoF family thiamine/hydroxymethylpyrimidine-binding protein n=1 Tax=Citricoccus sp. GCM10030269 TaxID=3273388 RepID=UPI0036060F0E
MQTPIPTAIESTAFDPTPQEFGVGARFTLSVMSDDYVQIILDALGQADPTGVDVTTGVVSTYVSGAEQDVLRYVSQVIAAAACTGAHVSAAVHLSRGCPGGVTCEIPDGGAALVSEVPTLEPAGVSCVADWALYPLADAGTARAGGDHMRDIYAAIDHARSTGVEVESDHYVTRLSGDLAQVLETIAAGWVLTGRTVQHVTTHATLSLNSPSAR